MAFHPIHYLCISVAAVPSSVFACPPFVPRIGEFKSDSMVFVDESDGKEYVVWTWDKNTLLETRVDVQTLGKSVPLAELDSMACVFGGFPGGQLPLSVEGGSTSSLPVLTDNREDGHYFILSRNFSEDVLLNFYHQAHQEVLGIMEVIL